MHLKSFTRKLRLLTIIFPLIVLAGCWGNGSGPSSTNDAKAPPPPPPLPFEGLLVDSNVTGAAFDTTTQSGLTDDGLFFYGEGEDVVFTVGTILLGVNNCDVAGAGFVTPVEMTCSANPTVEAATNLIVFLQSIDDDAPNAANGILISDDTRLAAVGQTLDFTSPTFDQDVVTVVAAIAPGNEVVDDQVALDKFYQTYVSLGGSNTFDWPFPGYPPFPSVDRDPLVDGGFEPPGTDDATLDDQGCVDDVLAGSAWDCFNFNFVAAVDGPSSAPVSHDAGGTQSMKQFGVDGGARNTIESFAGDTVELSAWAMNWVGDPFNNLAILQLTFWDAPGGELGGGNQVGIAIETFADTQGTPGFLDLSMVEDGVEVTDWSEMSVSAIAPAGTQSAQVLILHVLTEGTPDGGAIFWDDISLAATPATGPPADFELVFFDEFDGPNGSQPDPNKWNIEEGYGVNGWGNNEWQLYTDSPDNVQVKDGNLVIQAQCGSGGTPPVAGGTLLDPSFETPDASGGDAAGCAANAWECFNSNFVSSNDFRPGGSFVNPAAHDGTQVLKQFGGDAGYLQGIAVSPGDTVDAAAYAISYTGDPFNNLAILQLVFFDADGNALASGGNALGGNAHEAYCDTLGTYACDLSTSSTGDPTTDWQQIAVQAVAPAGTVTAQVLLLHVLTDGTPAFGSLFWDDVTLAATAPGGPVECDAGVRDGSVTSARITTQNLFSFKYGKAQARIKPAVGPATWPAFWMLGASLPEVGWPQAGEIDIVEMFNSFGSNDMITHFAIHWCDETLQAPAECSFPDGRVFVTAEKTFSESLGDDFHIFETEWNADRIIGKIDGQTYFSKNIDPDTMDEFQKEFFLLLNLAMGGVLGSEGQPPDGSEIWPQTMLVDYVRVFQAVDGPVVPPVPEGGLQDGSFEPPGTNDATDADQGCGGDSLAGSSWDCFNFNFVAANDGPSSAPVSHDAGGNQSVKQFGVDAGSRNSIEVSAGDTVELTAWAMNWEGDPFNNLAILQLTFWNAPGGELGGGIRVGGAVETFADTLGNQPVDLSVVQDGAEVSDWTEMTVLGSAPAGAQSAQVLLLHVLTEGTPDEGSLFWDDVTMTIQ